MILTQTELQLYVLKEDRITNRIENHFSQENIDVVVKEYNGTLAGINNVVGSIIYKKLFVKSVDFFIDFEVQMRLLGYFF